MSSTTLIAVVAVVGGLAFLVAMLVIVPGLVLRALAGPLKERVRARYSERDIVLSDLRANSFGLESRGRAQARGNGALVLTASELCFFQFLPKREDLVPLRAITETSIVRSHLGKATPFKLIKVSFAGDKGPDSIALMVKDAEHWQRSIDEERKKSAL